MSDTATATPETDRERENREMGELARSVAHELESESAFDPETIPWCSKCETCEEFEPNADLDGCANCDHDPSDHTRIGADEGDTIPDDIWNNVDWAQFVEDPETALREAYESWRETAADDVLDIRGEVSFGYDGDLDLMTLTAVLGTGGPHVEVTFDKSGRGHVRAYGWFMAGLTDIPVDISGHPIAELFDYYAGILDR